MVPPEELAELRARAALQAPSVDATTLQELRRLADELGRADRIRARTELSLTEQLTRRLSNGAVSIHPSSLMEASNAVAAADAELAFAEQALAEVGEEPGPDDEPDSEVEPEPAFHDFTSAREDEADTRHRRGGIVAFATVLVLLGVALILFALGAPPIAALGVILLALVAGFVLTVRGRREHDETIGLSEGSSALASATSYITMAEDEARARAVQSRWMDEKLSRQVVVDRAAERARSARRHWESLAGPEADPYDIDGVLRARDPQFELLGAATKASPTVRTANALHRAAAARWKIAWARLGHSEAPTLDQADLLLAHFDGDQDDATAEQAAVRLRAAEAWTEACAVLDRSLVFVEPSVWTSRERLEGLLQTLPAGADAVIVEREDASPETATS